MQDIPILEWNPQYVSSWLSIKGFDIVVISLLNKHKVDGKCLLALSEEDFRIEPLNQLPLGVRKNLYVICKTLQRRNQNALAELGLIEVQNTVVLTTSSHHDKRDTSEICESERTPHQISEDGRPRKLPPEKRKTFLAFLYVVAVTWITAFVMVIVHDRVPDMKKYPPLPDIFLDNVPHIPWAFEMCELCGTFLLLMWLILLLFHKHRFILMRRFFALSGTVFLLRCVTMLITSLSVPGAHLQCQPRNYTFRRDSVFNDLTTKMSQAYIIWKGAGMSIQGVRTCGDYMFSGHTVALTMLNFFITEYTPRHIYYLHTLSWIMNMFGIFFILAAHEHYSIDVFVAFYITSRLFLYYHTLSNNQALMQRDSNRTKIWFPLFSYFESRVEGIVPNEYETLSDIIENTWIFIRDICVSVKQHTLLLKTADSNTDNVPDHVIEGVNSQVLENKNK